jgi:hypothetical protein
LRKGRVEKRAMRYKNGMQAGDLLRGGQEWGLRRRNVGPGGEQVRKGEGLAVEGQQYKAGWEGCQE